MFDSFEYARVRISSETLSPDELNTELRKLGYYTYTCTFEWSDFSNKWVPVFFIGVNRDDDLLKISGMQKVFKVRENKETYYLY